MRRSPIARPGTALPVVLLTVALASALVVGGVYMARTLGTTVRLARTASALQSPVERAVLAVIASWDTTVRADQPVGTTAAEPSRVVDGLPVATWVTRLGDQTWWLVAETGVSQAAAFRRRIGLLVHRGNGAIRPVPGAAWAQLP